jgi:hypothetical protein
MTAFIPLLMDVTFEPEVIAAMGQAYERACLNLQPETGADLKEVIAKRIIQLAKRGEHDPLVLCARALEGVGVPSRASVEG